MSHKKRNSRILEKAQIRAAGLKMVDPKLDLGNSFSLKEMHSQMNALREQIDAYNGALAVIDTSKTAIENLEKSLGELSDRILTGIAFKYGKDSEEYVKAGGTRKSDRIRRSSATRMKNKAAQLAIESSETA